MSKDWKNDRAEASMHEYEQKKIAEAKEAYNKEEEQKWEDVKTSLYVGDRNYDDHIDSVIDSLKEKYHLPVKK
ncbi:MAG: hypothetical protein E6R13_08875 [Spirochaetes bacterium]|nr:MAG: hypothetical protein E6R13_08875 [Spirochaetota bacterium]